MGFFDNPMMASLAMGGMPGMEAAAGNPFGNQPSAQSSPMHTMMQMRAMRYMREPDARPMGGRMPGMGRSSMGGMMGASNGMGPTDYSQFTYDPEARQAAQGFLGQYGLSPLAPNQVQNNTILPNSGFFGRHPRLSGALEGGIYGAASAQGANTWGEGISSVANSMLAGPQMRHAAWERQFAAPFQAGSMFEQMQDASQKRDLQESEIQLRRAQTQRLNDPLPKPDHPITPIPAGDSSFMTYDAAGNATQTENKFYDPKAVRQPNEPGAAPFLGYFKSHGWDPETATQSQWKTVQKEKEQYDLKMRTTAPEQVHNANRESDAPSNIANKNYDAARGEMEKDVERMQGKEYFDETRKALGMQNLQSKSFNKDFDAAGAARKKIAQDVSDRKSSFYKQFPASSLQPNPMPGASGSWGPGKDAGKVQVKERNWNPTTGKLE